MSRIVTFTTVKGVLFAAVLALAGTAYAADSVDERVARLGQMQAELGPPTLSAQMADKLDQLVENVPVEVREKFDQKFANWAFYLRQKDVSDYYRSAKGRVFEDLVALGKDAIPLVLQKIVQPEQAFAIALYENILDDEALLAEAASTGERARGVELAKMWLDAQG